MLCNGFYPYKYWVFATGYTICGLNQLNSFQAKFIYEYPIFGTVEKQHCKLKTVLFRCNFVLKLKEILPNCNILFRKPCYIIEILEIKPYRLGPRIILFMPPWCSVCFPKLLLFVIAHPADLCSVGFSWWPVVSLLQSVRKQLFHAWIITQKTSYYCQCGSAIFTMAPTTTSAAS